MIVLTTPVDSQWLLLRLWKEVNATTHAGCLSTMLVTIEMLPPNQYHTTAQHWDAYPVTCSQVDLSKNSWHKQLVNSFSWATWHVKSLQICELFRCNEYREWCRRIVFVGGTIGINANVVLAALLPNSPELRSGSSEVSLIKAFRSRNQPRRNLHLDTWRQISLS